MYAIVATGGRQYRVEPGQRLEIEKVTAEAGSEIELADVLGEVKGKKIIVFKYKNKVRYRRKTGHRQRYSRLQIKEIQHGS